MQIPVPGVEDVRDPDPGLLAHPVDLGQCLPEAGARHDSVLDQEVRRQPANGRERALAPLPDQRALIRVLGRSDRGRARLRKQHLEPRGVGLHDAALPLELHDQECAARRIFRLHRCLGGLDRERVHDLDRHRQQAGLDDLGDGVPSRRQARVGSQRGARRLRDRDQPQRHLDRDPEQPLRPAEQPGPIRTDVLGVIAPQLHQLAVGQNHLHPQHVIAGHPVFEAVRAARS